MDKKIIKPEVLYHGSSFYLNKIKPRQESFRDKNEGHVVFASSDIAFASIFITRIYDDHSIKFKHAGVYYMIIDDEEKFRATDKKGYIYTLSSQNFMHDRVKGMKCEWFSRQAIIPSEYKRHRSGLEAMIEHGVQVYFLKARAFGEIQKIKEKRNYVVNILRDFHNKAKR